MLRFLREFSDLRWLWFATLTTWPGHRWARVPFPSTSDRQHPAKSMGYKPSTDLAKHNLSEIQRVSDFDTEKLKGLGSLKFSCWNKSEFLRFKLA